MPTKRDGGFHRGVVQAIEHGEVCLKFGRRIFPTGWNIDLDGTK
jgi:hypothetical protein